MEWKDEGVILGVRRHGETSVIVEIMTREHGRHMGLVRGGRSARWRAVLQPGNSVHLTWRARLDEHLGVFTCEPENLRAAMLMESATGLYGLQLMAAHLRLLPERDPHEALYRAGLVILDHLDEPDRAAALMTRFELALLEELGFGLDLSACAATGAKLELIWVSPKSGRAVSRAAGEPWADQLLALPPFMQNQRMGSGISVDAQAAGQGFALTRFFLDRHVLGPRGVKPPEARDGFANAILKAMNSELSAKDIVQS